MLAELLGKLDPDGVEGLDRSEDLLTAAVFGAVRHLPRSIVLRRLLERVGVAATEKDLRSGDVRLWPTFPRPGFPGRVIEPDVMILVGRRPVVFEAKLYSEFDTYDPPDLFADAGVHQLAVQYEAVRSWAAGERLDPPVVIAVTRGPARPDLDLAKARLDAKSLVPASSDDDFRWLSWRDVAAVIEQCNGLEFHEAMLVDDLLALMDKRGVRRMFEGFKPEDYWLVTAAQRVSSERLYPAIRTFFEDLGAVLQEDGISRSQPQYDAMWLGLGTGANRPSDWTRSFVARQYWPSTWRERTKAGSNVALYGLFDFLDPAFECGISVPGPGVTAAQQKWTPCLPDLASSLTALGEDYEIVVDTGDIARPARSHPATQVDEAWLQASVSSLVGSAHFRIRRRVDALSITVQQARTLLKELRAAALAADGLWQVLEASGYVAPAKPPAN